MVNLLPCLARDNVADGAGIFPSAVQGTHNGTGIADVAHQEFHHIAVIGRGVMLLERLAVTGYVHQGPPFERDPLG